MTVDQILLFFSKNNVAIIEGLVAAIILLGLFVGYRGFFGKKDPESSLGGGLDTAQLEKTLQKILDSQGTSHKTGDDVLSAAFKEGAGGHGESPEEVQQLKVSLTENIKELEVIRAELQISEKKVAELQAAGASGGAAPAAAGPAVDTSELDNKIKDLEARLAEYEIISEDIADLSRYKEENEQLKTEIGTLKEGAAAAPAAPAPTPAPEPVVAAQVPEPTPAPEVVEAAAPVEPEPTPELTELDVDAALAAAQAEAAIPTQAEEAAPAAEEAPAEAESVIDDELMREFAAAVEGQKKESLDSVAAKAGKGDKAAEGKSAEDSELMNEFENFVNKKS